MSKKTQIVRYHKVINHLLHERLSFEELTHKLENDSELHGEDLTVSLRTFQRDINDISDLYTIEIQFDRTTGKYYIADNASHQANSRLFEALETYNALNIKGALSDDIYFEERKPQGTHNLSGLLHAIQNNLEIKFMYQKFYDDSANMRHIDPYALKEFLYRWYVIGRDHKNGIIKRFGLDRIHGFEFTKKHFSPGQKADLNEKYNDCYGIISPNADDPSDVVISCTPMHGRYIQALPLHHSQHTIQENDEEIIIGLHVYLTHDFHMELLSYGEEIKVLAPTALVDQIKEMHKRSYERYVI